MTKSRTALTAETATVGLEVVKTANSNAIFEITEIRTDEYGTEARVRKQSATKGGLWYPVEDLFTA